MGMILVGNWTGLKDWVRIGEVAKHVHEVFNVQTNNTLYVM